MTETSDERTHDALPKSANNLPVTHGEDDTVPKQFVHRPALFDQMEWLRVTLHSIGDAVIATDEAGNITFLNPVAESLTGWSREDALGQPLETVFNIINETSRQVVENPARRALRDGTIVGLANHTLLIARDGTEVPIDDSAGPMRDRGEKVSGVVLIFRDISTRRRAEQTVEAALSYADSIISTLREPFLVVDKDLRIRSANTAFYATFRVTAEETEGCLLHEIGKGEWDIPRLQNLLEDVLQQGHAFQDFEIELDFPRVGVRTMLLNGRRFSGEGPHDLNMALLAIEDVTEQRRSEVALAGSEIRYRRLFESAKDGILILDYDTGVIVDANPFIGGILGYTHAELMGKDLSQIGLFNDQEASRNAFQHLLAQGYIRYENLPLVAKDGRAIEVEFVSNVYEEDEHSVIQCNIRDISARMRLEREVQRQTMELADLHRRKDEFLAMLSHELRNPLAPLKNAVHLMRLDGEENGLQKQARATIERQVNQLTRLIDDLLEVSRISTGKVVLRVGPLDMGEVVQNAVETAHPLIDQHRHKLSVSIPTQPVLLWGDAARLEQVVVNLLNNAAKYTADGGKIQIILQREADDAVVRVRDTGVGISYDLLPHVFDLFTQADRSLARSDGGLGIGLSVVKSLVELHGGTVDVTSSIGRGSEFTVRLPMRSSPAGQVLPHTQMPFPEQVPARSLRVLVVDDNVDAAEILALLLKAYGHATQTAHDGPAGLTAARDYRPDVVLLDIGLPEMDGFEVAKRLRGEPSLEGVVIVAMTGYGMESDFEQSKAAGMDHHLVKPADFVQVQQILAKVAAELPR